MQTLYMPDGDIVMDGQNNFAMATDDDEFMQCVNECIRVNLGEWFLDRTHGFDRFGVLSSKHDTDHETGLLYAAIFQEPRVGSIEELDFVYDGKNRKLTITYKITKKGSPTVIAGEVKV